MPPVLAAGLEGILVAALPQRQLKAYVVHEGLVTEHAPAPWLAHPVEFEKLH